MKKKNLKQFKPKPECSKNKLQTRQHQIKPQTKQLQTQNQTAWK